jgi:hypothetical protein
MSVCLRSEYFFYNKVRFNDQPKDLCGILAAINKICHNLENVCHEIVNLEVFLLCAVYRTLEYLMRHLARVAERGHMTGMTPRNVAIVWAPNLLRCKELEVGGVAALQGVGVQAVVTEFLVCYTDLIFCDGLPPIGTLPHPHGTAVSLCLSDCAFTFANGLDYTMFLGDCLCVVLKF